MRRLLMLKEKKTWKREVGFDIIEIAAEMDEQRFRTGLNSEPFYTKLYNPRWLHTPEEHKLKMNINVERLRMEIILLQPAPPPLCDSSPRRLPVVGTESDKPGVSRDETQLTQRETLPLQASVDGFLHVCTNTKQTTTILLQTVVGANDETATTKAQAAACKEFVRLQIGRQ